MDVDVARPASDADRDGWKAYWTAQGMPWRTEPEVDEERQQFLAERRAVQSNLSEGIYPFRDQNGSIRLVRADVEWLLATNPAGTGIGPVDWSSFREIPWSETLQRAVGVDLRGANLVGVNLRRLPLTLMRGGVGGPGTRDVSDEQRERAAVHLEGANLTDAHLEGATLRNAHLEGAILRSARLDNARLQNAHLEGATLELAHLEGAQFNGTRLHARVIPDAELQWLRGWKSDFPAMLLPADLGDAYCSASTRFVYPMLAPDPGCEQLGSTLFADIHWGDANLGIIDWATVRKLGNEYLAKSGRSFAGKPMDASQHMRARIRVVRTYLQLATALRAQGISEHAERFTYRALVLQRGVFFRERRYGRWLFSLVLAMLTGYGYRLERILFTYVLALTAFALVYYSSGLPNEHATTLLQHIADAYQVSLTAIHGRTFFEQFGIGSTLAWVAATESVCGLVIEAVFTSMLVQRFFAR